MIAAISPPRDIVEALDRYFGFGHIDLAKRKTPPVGATGDADADIYLAQSFATLVQIRYSVQQIAYLTLHVGEQDRILDQFHHMEIAGIGDARAKRSHELFAGTLRQWLRDLRGLNLDMRGQDFVEGRRASA